MQEVIARICQLRSRLEQAMALDGAIEKSTKERLNKELDGLEQVVEGVEESVKAKQQPPSSPPAPTE
jgi:hypothetical protein